MWLASQAQCARRRTRLPLQTNKSPFKQHVKDQATRTWVKPLLVAEVKFSEWTAAGEMRHPAFLGLREDKKPKDVMLEKEVHRKG
jgi:bifunctional non-homologous end joining protein LigD